MKTTLIFTLTLFFTIISNPIQAQDASNDATWEETIGFIRKNIKYTKDYWGSKYEIKGNSIESKSENWIRTMNFDKLKKVEERKYSTGEPYFVIISSGDYVKGYKISSKETQWDVILHIDVIDSEMYARLVKAFEHLAYLATEKRKAAREASGEKF